MKCIRFFIFATLLMTLPALHRLTQNGQAIEERAGANRAFVTNFGGDGISVIDLESRRLIINIKTGSLPHGVAIAPDGKAVYVANEGDGTLSVIDPLRNAVMATIPVGRKPNQLEVSADGKYVFVTLNGDDGLAVVDRVARCEPKYADEGKDAHGLAVTPDGKQLWLSTQTTDDVTILDTRDHRRLGRVTVGRDPNWIGLTTYQVTL